MTAPAGPEREKIIRSALSSLDPLKIKVMPVRAEKKRVVLELVAARFTQDTDYTQPKVNELLTAVYHDPVTLRRELVEARLLCRTPDGSRYWRPKPEL